MLPSALPKSGGPQAPASRSHSISSSIAIFAKQTLRRASRLLLSLPSLFLLSHSATARQHTPDADAFVRAILQHECQAQLRDHALWSYRETKKEAGQTKLYIVYQTRDGEIDRLTSINGQPLPSTLALAEDARINRFIHHPAEMRTAQHKKAADGERARNLLRMFPDAFHYQYDGRDGELVRLKFTPNPQFHVDSHPAQVFHHMEGTILLDPANRRLVAISGKLTSEVKFGYGILGHLDPGGTFEVQQREVSSGYWEVTLMHVDMRGKALFFKTIAEQENETYTGFVRVPDDTSPAQAAAFVRRHARGH